MTNRNGNLYFALEYKVLNIFCIQLVAVLLKAQFLPSVISLEFVSARRTMMVQDVTDVV